MSRKSALRALSCLALLVTAACGKGDAVVAGTRGIAAGDGAVGPAAKTARAFDKEQRNKGCEMLPPAMVAEMYDVPEEEFEQHRMVDCIYTWAKGGQEVQAQLMGIRVSEDEEAAIRWFENSTSSQTQQEIAKDMKAVERKAQAHETRDTEVERKAATDVGGAVAARAPGTGYVWTDVPEVGDAARVAEHDGSVMVRVGNMQFKISAYKGPGAPPLDYAGTDIQQVTKFAKERDAKWMDQTRQLRKKMSIELAKEVVAEL